MTDDLKERLLSWHPGQDEEALREEAVARITDLEARFAAAEAENTRLKRQVETLKTGWGIADRDRIKAEAGEDALAEALRSARDTHRRASLQLTEVHRGTLKGRAWGQMTLEIVTAALAAYEARRKEKGNG